MKIGYARVSTKDQGIAMQEEALRASGCEKVFVETVSGVSKDRPVLQEALEFLRADDVMVVWKLDRLARSLRQLIETVEQLHERGVGFASVTEAIDTTTPGGKMVFHVFGALAEFERELIRERTSSGLRSAKARGVKLGRPPAMTMNDLEIARSLKRAGKMTAAQIASHLGVSRATLYRALRE